jgi:hypothetical protein
MDNKPYLERSLLIPIGIGVFSIVGILIVGLLAYLDVPQPVASTGQTATPFKYILLATETSLSVQGIETPLSSQETIVAAPANPVLPPTLAGGSSTFPTQAPPQVLILPTNTLQASIPATSSIPASPTNTSSVGAASGSSQKYDETDEILDYDGNWQNQTGVGNAYQGTLTVSERIGNDVTFSVVGQQIVVGYLGGPDLGSITISIDDDEFLLDESTGNKWVSPQLSSDEHFVILFHEEGDLINLDYIEVVGSN